MSIISPETKVLNRQDALALVQSWRDRGDDLVFTNGCFDILHIGHIRTLTTARSQGDRLLVGVNSDASVKRLKGPTRPINSESDRAVMLAALNCVDAVVIFEEDTPNDLIALLQPETHVKGGDYKKEDLPEAKIVDSYGGRIVIVDLVPDRSTTSLIQKTRKL